MTTNIGFIGGGQMAEAIIKGLLQSDLFSDSLISVSEPLDKRKQYLKLNYNLKTVDNSVDLCSANNVIVLAVKPQVMPAVLYQIKASVKHQLVITIAAGLPISYYVEQLENPSMAIVRVMPNMPALIQQGATALCRNSNVSNEDYALANTLFNTIGSTVNVAESLMDAVTGLSGSGPAYVFSFIEAMIDGGVKVGLSREVAQKLTLQTIQGAVQLTKSTESHPAVLRDQVTSPGGTTASGLHVLESNGFNGIVMSAVEAAFNKSVALGYRK